MARAKVVDKPDLEKDMVSGAVINTNADAFAGRRARMAANQERDNDMQTMKAEIEELKKLVKKLSK